MVGEANNNPLGALDQVIDVAGWVRDQEFEVHPVGSKPKSTITCPVEVPHPLLIGGHSYLLKLAEGWKGQQIWSEALAYQVGCAVGIDVPPCFIAMDSATGEVGALIEFFYRYPTEAPPRRLIHGADLLQARGFTKGADRPHDLLTNIGLSEDRGLPAPLEWWAKTVTFDALIGNTDRHTENWGILVDAAGEETFAPRFDNGTSLGFQKSGAALEALLEDDRLDAFIAGGSGHLGWDAEHDQKTPLIDLCGKLNGLENAGAAIQSVIQTDLGGVEAAIEACIGLEVEPRFSALRGEVILKMIERRRAHLIQACGG